ncbi:transcription termination/antitermination protein NusG [Bradyrhizobium sp. AZCC 2289]|uniref:transcription termination/antitermination protein NusG n=1 Tax=Bradyrhizobium sp. AZCC 2289 TaxID=3117026 RepID=UPI002FF02993
MNFAATNWYVVQTHPHSESRAELHLSRQGFEVYLPKYLKRRRHARKSDAVAVPLFPGYLFVAIDLMTQRWRSVSSTIGVTRLVCRGDAPAELPPDVIAGLRQREDGQGFVQQLQYVLSPGDQIRVVDGAFSDFLGLFEGMTAGERVAVLLDLLGRKVRVVMDAEVIEAA